MLAPRPAAAPAPPPLALREWNALAKSIAGSDLKRPAGLLGKSTDDLASALGIAGELAERLARLLDRGATLAVELERLEAVGVWAMTRADDDYPKAYKRRLRDGSPPVLFGAGDRELLARSGLAVVGSRAASAEALSAAGFLGRAAAASGLATISGGAKGVDGVAMGAALEAGGVAVGVLADALERAIRAPAWRDAAADGRLTLLTPYAPKAPFSVGNAMGRNRLIYALADRAIVVASDAETGGTWAGATEALKAGWVPMYVCDGPGLPAGNALLRGRGAASLPVPFAEPAKRLADWLAGHAPAAAGTPTLF